jgi:hypothetical protein
MLREKNAILIQNLNEVIKKYSKNSKVRDLVMDEFKSRNMKGGNAVNILNERLELSTLDIDNNKDLILLFVFSVGIFNALTKCKEDGDDIVVNLENINPENYFTKIEMETFTDYKIEKEEELLEEIVFEDMIQISDHQWVGRITAQYLAKLDAGNEFVYNFKTQRDPVFDIYGMKRIRLDKQKVKEITDGILSGEQFPDAIAINILHDGNDELFYDQKNHRLTVVSGVKNIFDGQHRKVSNSLAVEKRPDLDYNWILTVTNLSEVKAQKAMVQINKQKPMKTDYIKSLDTSKLGNLVVDAIRDIDTSEFATKIKDNDKELEFGGLVTKSRLAQAIEENYKDELKNRLQVKPIAKHIANIADQIIGLYTNEFIVNPEETSKTSVINHKNIFYGFVALSELLYNEKNWEEKLEQALNKVDFFWFSKNSCLTSLSTTNLISSSDI